MSLAFTGVGPRKVRELLPFGSRRTSDVDKSASCEPINVFNIWCSVLASNCGIHGTLGLYYQFELEPSLQPGTLGANTNTIPTKSDLK